MVEKRVKWQQRTTQHLPTSDMTRSKSMDQRVEDKINNWRHRHYQNNSLIIEEEANKMGKACISPVFQRQMEQMRNIKNLIFDNDAMGELPPLTRLLFAGLWTMVDDKGRMEDNPRKIKKVIMGYDDVNAAG
jgi:hypothetical protein